jgi:hypothetical protein
MIWRRATQKQLRYALDYRLVLEQFGRDSVDRLEMADNSCPGTGTLKGFTGLGGAGKTVCLGSFGQHHFERFSQTSGTVNVESSYRIFRHPNQLKQNLANRRRNRRIFVARALLA